MKKIQWKNILIFLFIIIIFYIITYSYLYQDYIDYSDKKYDLKQDGVIVIKNVLNEDKINNLKTACMKKEYESVKNRLSSDPSIINAIYSNLGNDYELQDYIWIIQKSSVHTCHRDNNGDFFNDGQKYPSYTLLIYLEDMEKCLGVVPESHLSKNSYGINMTNPVINLLCNRGDMIIFNANLIHVGTLNQREDNLRIQMKITHREDRKVLDYYENFHKVSNGGNGGNNVPMEIRRMQKNASCMFPIISDFTQREYIRTARGSDNGVNVGIFQKIFSYIFYGNSNYYDIPNAW
jgi:ectoine hydroxylase-related dioxygenase (phytanoyl-CoA dioxygenase family)